VAKLIHSQYSKVIMYITNIEHFLDESGSIPKEMPKAARQLASFYTFIIEAATSIFPATAHKTNIRCFEKGCKGMVSTDLTNKKDDIHWKCNKCPNEGKISNWQGTTWDYLTEKKTLKPKKVKTESIKIYDVNCVELFVDPNWHPMIEGLELDGSEKVLHGEFFFRGSLEDCQIIVSETFINKFISQYDFILNAIKDQFFYFRTPKETQKKLILQELKVEFLFLMSDNSDLQPEDLDEEGNEYVFRLIE
jgi:hypothetical protein